MKDDVYDNGASAATSTTMRHQGAERRSSSAPSDSDKADMMRKAEAAGTPGPEHKGLEHFVGNWKCEVQCWMDPNGAPNKSQGSAKVTSIMNGRFIQEDFKGEMMGKPFHGRTILGYNKQKQTFQSVWFDDLNTSMFTSEGKGDQKTITLEGKNSCPATGRMDIPMKVVLRVLSPDKHSFEMFDGSKGNARTMEIIYTRQ